MRLLLLVASLLAAVSVRLPAQQQGAPGPGDRVRVSAPRAFRAPVVGTFHGVKSGNLSVRESAVRGDTLEIPLELVTRLELSRGRRSRGETVRRAGLQGLAGGLLVGGAVGLIRGYGADYRNPDLDVDVLGVTARTAARFGLLGAGIGVAVGLRSQERWVMVELPR